MKWLDEFPWWILLVVAIALGLAPFQPEPHLWEKWKLLQQGELHRAIDIFDMVFHASGIILFVLKLVRMRQLKQQT